MHHKSKHFCGAFYCESVVLKFIAKNNEPHQRYDSLFLAETARFELAGDCSLTDFEQKAVSTAPPLSVPEMCNTSADFARNSKTNDFLREICEIDARKQ